MTFMLACYEPSPLDPSSVCHPQEPQCAMLDYDGDGVTNGIDEFPLDANCYQNDEDNCGKCGRRCDVGMYCNEEFKCLPRPSETCDGRDNDYDEIIDEALIAPRSDLWQGVCMGLSKVCRDQSWQEPTYQELSTYEELETVCDGLDNDCDGRVDEDLTPPLAGLQQGVCTQSQAVCMGMNGWQDPIWAQNISNYETIEISCDGLDNDCDGITDEDLDGDPCITGLFGLCQGGYKVCRGGELSCEAQYQINDESCDGLDNDCDGAVDEDLQVPSLDDAVGVCQDQIQRCKGIDGWELLAIEQLMTYEVVEQSCDGLDNDCDGSTDENIVNEMCEITDALGPCRFGITQCQSGISNCITSHPVQNEFCDGVDNDCDGTIDEDLSDIAYQEQRGVCRGLVQVCQGIEGWNDPDLSRVTHYEVTELSCDGLDNDCDGYTDESLPLVPCDSGQVGQCRWGHSICQDGFLQCLTPSASTEVCDGVDNDCDGGVDEALVPPIASAHLGVCQGRVQICRGLEGWEDPLPIVVGYEESELSCDGLDNDCDGQVDEELQGELMGQQTGVCEGSRQQCTGGLGWQDANLDLSISEYEETESLCDGLDNDCDGKIDENTRTDVCQSTLSGVCQSGHWQCSNGNLVCISDVTPISEACDLQDNDCDGRIDENLQQGICAVGVGACLRESSITCVNGEFICVGEAGVGSHEVCNGIDDDCDGAIDEESQWVGLTCANGVGSCQRQGLWSCQQGVLRCNVSAGVSTQENCDGLDNDCDGRIDETFVQLGRLCSVGEGVCAVQSTWRCGSTGQLQCGEEVISPVDEQCDQLDNDCDGNVDEHANTEICDQLDNDCDGFIDEGIGAEICDQLDNDCDGYVDENPCTICQTDCPSINWIRVAPGDFNMGSLTQADQQPIHAVRIKGFDASQEITVSQYQKCVDDNACTPTQVGGSCNAGRAERENHPINCVNWYQAQQFAYWMGARLPSEAQWEYMARNAGEELLYPWGNLTVDCTWAHVTENQLFGCALLSTQLTCQYPQGNTSQGLCDLIGNVAEWVLDDYQPDYQEADPNGGAYCTPNLGCAPQGEKVYRGGGWRTSSDELDAYSRFHHLYFVRDANIGFRIVRSGEPDDL